MMLGLNGEGFIGTSTERGEGRKARHLVCAQAAMASCRDHCAESSGEEQTFWSLTESVHNLSSAP